MRSTEDDDAFLTESPLFAVLSDSRDLGFLGPGPLDPQIRHAEGFVAVARRVISAGSTVIDMGAGGGLPGLVVAARWPEISLLLLDASERRTEFLREAVERLGMSDRVQVVQARAEIGGRDPALRGAFDGALARSFGRPAVLAECTAPLLRPGGWLVVSEPPPDPEGEPGSPTSRRDYLDGGQQPLTQSQPPSPESDDRWPRDGLRQFGLEPRGTIYEGFAYQLLEQVDVCPDRYPRRNGVPAKKPLF